ncbi:copper resistance protein B [Piscinibacter koreensis]|uniref:copper resistance protein B n=1 Tax=Piscinibacter koreensis TaxID=2742824 RepID=UPI001C37AAC0
MIPLAQAQKIAPVEDSPIRSYFLIDQLEHTTTRYTGGTKADDALRFNTAGWVGGDYNRLWAYAEGTKPYNSKLEGVDLQLLYGRLVAPFWDVQAGVRYAKPRPEAPGRSYAVFGVQGMAPYRFEVQAAAFVSERGNVSARAELEYELLLTQRWVLQPRLATNIALQKVREQGIGRGLNDVEMGLRLRYEIRREFGPYVGASWQRSYGGTAQFARNRGEDIGGWSLVAGVRAWF